MNTHAQAVCGQNTCLIKGNKHGLLHHRWAFENNSWGVSDTACSLKASHQYGVVERERHVHDCVYVGENVSVFRLYPPSPAVSDHGEIHGGGFALNTSLIRSAPRVSTKLPLWIRSGRRRRRVSNISRASPVLSKTRRETSAPLAGLC